MTSMTRIGMCSWTANPRPCLRCNFIMRGVYLTPGAHTVEFKFSLPLGLLYVSLSAIGVGILLCGFLIFFNAANLCRLTRPAGSGLHHSRARRSMRWQGTVRLYQLVKLAKVRMS